LLPRWLSSTVLLGYAAMVATSKSHFTGSTVASEYRAKDTHLINLEYYNASLLMENSLELRDDRPQIFGQHPHGL
jgi:hypothetical protein